MGRIGFLCLLLISSAIVQGQTVSFVDNASWQQIQQRARQEQKYIFVDCFATWCKPCREMDAKVYTAGEVAKVTNDKFISVKVQMDSTGIDNDQVKSWRPEAALLQKKYGVSSFPTYLFFAPDGRLVHRGLGLMNPSTFVNLLQQALDPATQYYTMVGKVYNKQFLPDSVYEQLIRDSYVMKDEVGRRTVARAYIDRLEKLAREGRFDNGKAVAIINEYLSAGDKNIFHLLWQGALGKDSVLGDSVTCRFIVRSIIEREEIEKHLVSDRNYQLPLVDRPNWNRMARKISRKYNASLAEEAILCVKRRWYRLSRPDWEELARAHVEYYTSFLDIKNGGKLLFFSVNNVLWNDVFLHVQDKRTLLKAAEVQYLIVERRPEDATYMDTYANLLYKAGELEKAVEWQGIAVSKNTKDTGNASNLEKMKRGLPTWTNQ